MLFSALLALSFGLFSGCQIDKDNPGPYRATLYSGGEPIRVYDEIHVLSSDGCMTLMDRDGNRFLSREH